jgi:hypothetical protein
VKDGLVVSLFSAEQVIHNACELVSRGGDGLGFAELPSDTPKELTEIIFGMMQGVGRHAERSGNAAPDAEASCRLIGTYPHDAQLDYFRIADDTPGIV